VAFAPTACSFFTGDSPVLLVRLRVLLLLAMAMLPRLLRVALGFSLALISLRSFAGFLFLSCAWCLSRSLCRRRRSHFLTGSRHLGRSLFGSGSLRENRGTHGKDCGSGQCGNRLRHPVLLVIFPVTGANPPRWAPHFRANLVPIPP